ncbi:MAG: septum formation initiator family protein [Aestuariivirga sp.]
MRRFDLAVTCVCCALLGYFAWHGWKGPRGFPYQEQLQAKMEVLTGKQAEVVTSRRQLEEKVALLRPESIDPDLLDEMARGQLQMARPGDLVVYTNR